jgi:hypothetical protein
MIVWTFLLPGAPSSLIMWSLPPDATLSSHDHEKPEPGVVPV